MNIAKIHNLKVIEDCAHCLGAEYKGEKLGTWGDVAILSFNRDKVISSVYGGCAVTNDHTLAKKLRDIQSKLPWATKKTIFSHLMHPLIFAMAVPSYDFCKLGRVIIRSAQRFKLISKIFLPAEKKAVLPSGQPAKFPNALAKIALNQLKHLDQFNQHRQKIAKYYHEHLKSTDYNLTSDIGDENSIYLRFPVRSKHRAKLIACARKRHIYLGDWYDTVVAPHDVHPPATAYQDGDCPEAEKAAVEVFNLPTHQKIRLKQAKKIVELLIEFEKR